jgi:hypothetical protein
VGTAQYVDCGTQVRGDGAQDTKLLDQEEINLPAIEASAFSVQEMGSSSQLCELTAHELGWAVIRNYSSFEIVSPSW